MAEDLSKEIGADGAEELRKEAEATSMILVVGETGAGKSHFINAIAPGSCAVSPRLESCTQKPASILVNFESKKLLLIDTPGFNDTRSSLDRSDAVILGEIAQLIAAQATLGVQMRGMLYLHDITGSARMTGETLRQLELLRRICGKENWDHVALVTTKWPEPDNAWAKKMELPTRESDLRRDFWKDMLRNGSKMYRFIDTSASAQSIIRWLLQKQPVDFALQTEMKATKSLAKTSAGKFVIEARKLDEIQHSALSQDLAQENHAGETIHKEIDELQESIDKRKRTEGTLEQDVEEKVKKTLKARIKEEFDRTGQRPTVISIFQLLIGVGSFVVSIMQLVG